MRLLYLFFFLMLFLPTMYQPIRGVLLLILCLAGLNMKYGRIDSMIRFFLVLNLIACFFNWIYSLIVGNPGALANVSIFLIWPALYFFLMMKCKSMDIVFGLYKVIVYGGLIVLAENVIFIGNNFFLNSTIIESLGELLGFRYGIYDGFIEYFSPSQSYLPYFFYFSCSMLLVPHGRIEIENKWLIVMAVTSAILILISGRRAMWLTIGVLPIYLMIILKICKLQSFSILKILSLCVVIVGVLFYALVNFFNLEYMTLELLSTFDMESNESNMERVLQNKSLLNDFWNSPIIGQGIGFVSSYVRTPDHPWEYELVYQYLLASFGLLGMLVLCMPFVWVLKTSIDIVNKTGNNSELIIPALAGSFVFFLINATNPYLLKFDFLWIFFLPIIVLNQIRININRQPLQ